MDASLFGRDVAVQSAAAALASLGFGLVFQTPRRHLLAGTLVGAAGWAVYLAFARGVGRPFWGTFAAALTVGLASECLARLHRESAIVFSVPGIIPLVPGTTVYWACLALLEGQAATAALLAGDALRFALGIAGGLACSTRLARTTRPLVPQQRQPGAS